MIIIGVDYHPSFQQIAFVNNNQRKNDGDLRMEKVLTPTLLEMDGFPTNRDLQPIFSESHRSMRNCVVSTGPT
jgi:hypothetical protein